MFSHRQGDSQWHAKSHGLRLNLINPSVRHIFMQLYPLEIKMIGKHKYFITIETLIELI